MRQRNQDCQQENCNTNRPTTYFGHTLSEVETGTFRIGTINVNNLSAYENDSKDLSLSSDIHRCELDITLLQEVGVNWSKVPRESQLRERMKDHFDLNHMKVRLGFNNHDKLGATKQRGGTGVLSNGKLSHFTMETGTDKSGLGRWTWVHYRGKNNVTLRVVSIYQLYQS